MLLSMKDLSDTILIQAVHLARAEMRIEQLEQQLARLTPKEDPVRPEAEEPNV